MEEPGHAVAARGYAGEAKSGSGGDPAVLAGLAQTEALLAVATAIDRLAAALSGPSTPAPSPVHPQAYQVEEIRRRYPNAYRPWTAQTDAELLAATGLVMTWPHSRTPSAGSHQPSAPGSTTLPHTTLPHSPVRPARTRTQAHPDDRRAGSWPLMRVVWLSDHPRDMLQDAQQRRAVQDRDKQLAHENALATYRQHAAQARDARDQARMQRRWGAWLRGVFAVRRADRQIPAARLPTSQPTHEEERLAAGATGEQLVADALALALDDDWVLFRGYRNRRGEIDHVLLGPRGLFALEEKNHNARIDYYGDQWWSTKYDRYGKPVGPRREMSDKRGRSPRIQLNEPASQLEDFLPSRSHPVPVGRVVVLTHHRAQLRSCTRPTVHVCTSVRQILNLLNAAKVPIGPAERAELERLIVRDHRFHENRRSR